MPHPSSRRAAGRERAHCAIARRTPRNLHGFPFRINEFNSAARRGRAKAPAAAIPAPFPGAEAGDRDDGAPRASNRAMGFLGKLAAIVGGGVFNAACAGTPRPPCSPSPSAQPA